MSTLQHATAKSHYVCLTVCHTCEQCLPYILAYKPTIISWILTIKLWESAYTRVIAQQPELARHGPRHGPLVGTCRLPRAAGPHANCCCCVCIPVWRLALQQVDTSPDVRVRAVCVGMRHRNRGLRRPRGVTMHRSRVLVRRRLPLYRLIRGSLVFGGLSDAGMGVGLYAGRLIREYIR